MISFSRLSPDAVRRVLHLKPEPRQNSFVGPVADMVGETDDEVVGFFKTDLT